MRLSNCLLESKNKIKGSSLFLTHSKNIIEKKVQDQTPGSMLIWVLFLNKHGNIRINSDHSLL
jgi:hypothetical protein